MLINSTNKHHWLELWRRHELEAWVKQQKQLRVFVHAVLPQRVIHWLLLPRVMSLWAISTLLPHKVLGLTEVIPVVHSHRALTLTYPTPGLALTSTRPSTGHLPPCLGFLSSQSLLVTGQDLLHLQVDLVSHLSASAPCCSPPPTSHPSLSTRSPHSLWHRTRLLSWPTHRKCCRKRLLTGLSVTSITQAQSQDLGLHPARSHREHSASWLRSSSAY